MRAKSNSPSPAQRSVPCGRAQKQIPISFAMNTDLKKFLATFAVGLPCVALLLIFLSSRQATNQTNSQSTPELVPTTNPINSQSTPELAPTTNQASSPSVMAATNQASPPNTPI